MTTSIPKNFSQKVWVTSFGALSEHWMIKSRRITLLKDTSRECASMEPSNQKDLLDTSQPDSRSAHGTSDEKCLVGCSRKKNKYIHQNTVQCSTWLKKSCGRYFLNKTHVKHKNHRRTIYWNTVELEAQSSLIDHEHPSLLALLLQSREHCERQEVAGTH